MKFGLNLPNFGAEATPETLAGWALRAEEAGFHLVMVSDHVALVPEVQRGFPAPFYDPFTALAWLAAKTRTIELGTTVTILPYRHPLQTARIAANIDQLSGGRLILGVAAGWSRQEFATLGVPFSERGRRTDDYLAAIRKLWSSEVASFESPSVSFQGVHTGPRPARVPHPPIWVGGQSPAALRRAARLGEAWHPQSIALSWIERTALPQLERLADAAGRRVPALAPRLKLRITTRRVDDQDRTPGIGTLDQIRGDVERLSRLGATHILLDTTIPGEPRPPGTMERDWRWIERFRTQAMELARDG